MVRTTYVGIAGSEDDRKGRLSDVEPWQIDHPAENVVEAPRLPLIGLVADARVIELANKLAEKKQKVSMSMCIGPAIVLVRAGTLLHVFTTAGFFTAGYFLVECACEHKHTHTRFPIYVWLSILPVWVVQFVLEWKTLKLSTIPFIQFVGRFTVSSVPVGFTIWCLCGFASSAVNVATWSNNSLFAAEWVHCQFDESIVKAERYFQILLQHSFLFQFVVPYIKIKYIAVFTWLLCFPEVLHPVMVTMARTGTKLCREVVQKPESDGSTMYYDSICGLKQTTGSQVSNLADSAGMGCVIVQNPRFAIDRGEKVWRDIGVHDDDDDDGKGSYSALPSAACVKGCGRARHRGYETCCVRCRGPDGPHHRDCTAKDKKHLRRITEYYHHIESLRPFVIIRLILRGCLKHTTQVNLQITMFGIVRAIYHESDDYGANGIRTHLQELISIGLIFVSCMPLVFNGVDIVTCVYRAISRIQTLLSKGLVKVDDREEDDPKTIGNKLWNLRVTLFMACTALFLFFAGQMYAFVKLLMLLFFCDIGELWNMPVSLDLRNGCINPAASLH